MRESQSRENKKSTISLAKLEASIITFSVQF